jgi:hypothetical protein
MRGDSLQPLAFQEHDGSESSTPWDGEDRTANVIEKKVVMSHSNPGGPIGTW